jgi:predicted SAM-dependent methyltransferase
LVTSTFRIDASLPAGQAIRTAGPRPYASINGKTSAEFVPRNARPDLADQFGGQINFGFHHVFRKPILEDAEISLIDADAQHVAGSPQRIRSIQTDWLDGSKRLGLASHYLKGSGLEIGALHNPLSVAADTTVRYVDRMSREALYTHYPELRSDELIEPDVIANGEALEGFANESEDFIIANHFLEHTQDPIDTLKNFARVLRPGGILYLALPDKNATFDRDRELTTFEHLARDHDEGPQHSRHDHFVEWVRLKEKCDEKSLDERVRHLEKTDYSIHFHVWDPLTFVSFLSRAIPGYDLPIEIIALLTDREEFIVILRRR